MNFSLGLGIGAVYFRLPTVLCSRAVKGSVPGRSLARLCACWVGKDATEPCSDFEDIMTTCLQAEHTHAHHLGHQASCWTAPCPPISTPETSAIKLHSFHLVHTSDLVPSSSFPANVHTQASGWGHTLLLETPLDVQQAPHSSSSAPWNWTESNLSAWGYNEHGQVNALCQKWVLVTCDTPTLATCMKESLCALLSLKVSVHSTAYRSVSGLYDLNDK